MCYLPKITFYLYFGFFFLGYIWVFGILFYNTWKEGGTPSAKLQPIDQSPRPPFVPGIQPQQKNSELLPVPYFDMKQKPPDFEAEPRCIQMVNEPKFHVCVHDPTIDKGISAHIDVYKEWEKELTNELSSVLKKNPSALFVDVGANIGYYSLLAAKLGHSVIAIEPFMDNLHLFRHSAELNHLSDKILVIPASVSDKRGNLTLADAPENFGGRFVISSDEQKFMFRARKKTTVNAIILDDLLTVPPLGHNRAIKLNATKTKTKQESVAQILMKIDIQGHECFAIRGAQQLIQRIFVSPIFMEWEESRKHEPNRRCLTEMLENLGNLGYRAFALDGRMLRDLDPSDLTLPQDIVWRKIIL